MINSYTSWQPLEEVIVGRAYTPDYFDFIDNRQVRNQLQQILAETAEDLDALQRTIEQSGARVRRPDLIDKDHFIARQLTGQGAPLPPLTPRDWPHRRPRHARTARRKVPERPGVGIMHHHLPAVGMETERYVEVAPAVPANTRHLRRRRRQSALQRRPDAHGRNRVAPGGTAQGDGCLAGEEWGQHLRHAGRSVEADQSFGQHA